MPSVTEPVTTNNSKQFGCLCCTSGPLSATVNVPRVGYAPGEAIPVSTEIEKWESAHWVNYAQWVVNF